MNNLVETTGIVYPNKIIFSELTEFNVDEFGPTLHPKELYYKHPVKKAVLARLLGLSVKAIDGYLYNVNSNPLLTVQRLAAELDRSLSD